MTGTYDEMSEKSYPNYKGRTKEERELRDLLITKMEANGFTVYKYENSLLTIKVGNRIAFRTFNF